MQDALTRKISKNKGKQVAIFSILAHSLIKSSYHLKEKTLQENMRFHINPNSSYNIPLF